MLSHKSNACSVFALQVCFRTAGDSNQQNVKDTDMETALLSCDLTTKSTVLRTVQRSSDFFGRHRGILTSDKCSNKPDLTHK